MAKELLHGPKSLFITDPTTYSNATLEYIPEGCRITGFAWVRQYEQLIDEKPSWFVKVDPNLTFYYDIVYSNLTPGNQIYIGFERYDENQATGSNQATIYVVSRKDAIENCRVTGTINLNTVPINGETKSTNYIRLRILNQWTGSNVASGQSGILEIKGLSLLQLENTIPNPKIQRSTTIFANNFRENDIKEAKIFKREGIESNCFYEI